MGLFQELNDAGITILMVTHELDVAAFCKRIIVMKDGRILSDELNRDRRFAESELAKLNEAEQAAQLA
jgi:putative ABC transport system ATP-binding protein